MVHNVKCDWQVVTGVTVSRWYTTIYRVLYTSLDTLWLYCKNCPIEMPMRRPVTPARYLMISSQQWGFNRYFPWESPCVLSQLLWMSGCTACHMTWWGCCGCWLFHCLCAHCYLKCDLIPLHPPTSPCSPLPKPQEQLPQHSQPTNPNNPPPQTLQRQQQCLRSQQSPSRKSLLSVPTVLLCTHQMTYPWYVWHAAFNHHGNTIYIVGLEAPSYWLFDNTDHQQYQYCLV